MKSKSATPMASVLHSKPQRNLTRDLNDIVRLSSDHSKILIGALPNNFCATCLTSGKSSLRITTFSFTTQLPTT